MEVQRRNSIERYKPKHSVDEELSDQMNACTVGSNQNKPKTSQRRRTVNNHLYSSNSTNVDSPKRGRGRGRGRGQGRGERNSRNIEEEKGKWDNCPNINNDETRVKFHYSDEKEKHCSVPYHKNGNNFHGQYNKQNSPRKQNTETFKPSHKPADMRILTGHHGWLRYMREMTSRDVLVIHDLFCAPDDLTIYNKLLDEIKSSGTDQIDLWLLWHGDSHVIADDKKRWKERCPTFLMILDKIRDYFQMDIKATRLNWYRDSNEWKPFHHDAAAIKPDKAKTQNMTVGVSFGAERDAAFEHATTKTVISMPQPNGTIYTFGKDVNVIWRHGILQVPPERYHTDGRISIIAWGWVEQTPI